MNTVIITRDKYTDKETFGTLIAHRNGQIFRCKTLELPWKDNQRNISCIPKGIYPARYTFWLAKMRYNYLLQNVPKRLGIFLHAGNYGFKKYGEPDIKGCILLGISYADINDDQVLDITTTKATVNAFQEFLHHEPFELKVQ